MRLWSLHPSLLDRAGLVALWREALLAQKVLTGTTKGYRHHPQLDRFRQTRKQYCRPAVISPFTDVRAAEKPFRGELAEPKSDGSPMGRYGGKNRLLLLPILLLPELIEQIEDAVLDIVTGLGFVGLGIALFASHGEMRTFRSTPSGSSSPMAARQPKSGMGPLFWAI